MIPPIKTLLWPVAFLLQFISAVYLSWILSATADYFYSSWYQLLDIEEHIETYAPQNRYGRASFNDTSQAQRIDLFAEVVDQVHSTGEGLSSIRYHSPVENKEYTLFTQAEVVHLTDVAILISRLNQAGLVICILTGLLTIYLYRKKIRRPPIKVVLLQLTGFVTFLLVLVLIIGPETVFNQFHVWVFPDEHPWFFFYQDSLMSTFMKAPDLFGAIAAQIFLFAIAIMVAMQVAQHRVIKS